MQSDQNFKILSYKNELEREIWRSVYNSFKEIDIFYYSEYCKLFDLHGDGEPFLFVYYESEKDVVIYPFLKRSLKKISGLKFIEQNLFDITSPYGYGGYLASSSTIDMEKFFTCFHKYCLDNNIIAEFIRFHPILENAGYAPKLINIKQYNQTIIIELNKSEEEIWMSMNQACRNKIRKAIKNDVYIHYDKCFENIDHFIKLYYATMKRLGAHDYYYFSPNWFTELTRLLQGKVYLFHAYHEGIIIASALFVEQNPYIHYFLTGSLFDMRHIAATNLLLYEVALWAKKKGLKYFHLGGGYFPNDSLFRFKSSFSPCKKDFYIGMFVHHNEYYEYVCKLKFQNEIITKDIVFFPIYRRPNK